MATLLNTVNSVFSNFAVSTSWVCGRAVAFVLALALVVGWLACGWLFNYSDSWSLFINTITTIITFLMVFLLQHTQSRDTLAIMLKLDELIATNTQASNRMLKLDELTEDQLERLREEFKRMADREQPVPDHRA